MIIDGHQWYSKVRIVVVIEVGNSFKCMRDRQLLLSSADGRKMHAVYGSQLVLVTSRSRYNLLRFSNTHSVVKGSDEAVNIAEE